MASSEIKIPGIVKFLRGPLAGVIAKVAPIDAARVEVLVARKGGGFGRGVISVYELALWGIEAASAAERVGLMLALLPPVEQEKALALILETCQDSAEAWIEIDPSRSEALRWIADFGGAALRNDP